jgi:hypothetical protein
MKRTVANKNTPSGTKSKFAFIVWAKIRPTSATKSAKSIIIGCDIQETFSWTLKIKHFGRKNVYEKCGGKKGFIPKLERHGRISKK